jgi:hypothetical protein
MEHSETEDRKTKTYLYVNGPIGKIECKSSSCQASHPDKMKAYLRHFSKEMVKATSPARNWRNQPLVVELFEKRIAEQSRANLDTMDSMSTDNTWQQFEAAKVNAMGMKDRDPDDVKEFSKWFTTQSLHKDHKDPASWQAWLDSCNNTSQDAYPRDYRQEN